ncbi:MAG: DUF885 domain-containing protein, partial [Microbacteriaceae bacterium]
MNDSALPTRTSTPIDAIAEKWVDTQLELSPEYRVYLGREGDQSAYGDYSPAGIEAELSATRSVLAEIRAAEVQDDVDRITKLDLTRELELAIEKHDAGFALRDLNVIASPAQGVRDVFDLMPRSTESDWSAVAARLHNLPDAMSGYIETLREGIRQGRTPAIRQVREIITQADKQVASDGFFFQLADSAADADVPQTLRDDLAQGARESAEAYRQLSTFLHDELAAAAPEKDAVGRELYSLASRSFLGAEVDLDETYEWGIEELARMVAEQESIAAEIVEGGGVAEAVAFLDRDESRKLHGTDALQRWMQETSDRAVEELGRTHFDIPAEIRTLECMIAPTQEGGIYYTAPSEDFERAGRMWWSVPEGITEFDTWRELTTVYHEGVPGHHLQIGLATYNSAQLNGWRRLNWNSGHGEGWALYAERLMADLGYLDDPAD